MKDHDLVLANTVVDLGDLDTVTLDSCSTTSITCANYASMSDTITFPPSSYSLGTNSSVYTSASYAPTNSYTSNAGSGYNWSTAGTSSPFATVNISDTGIDMSAGTDITVDGKSLKDFMKKMEQRLSILVPDPVKLEKFQALKQAYEHYKTMESLCFDEPEESQE